jgi:hypothetical protein
MSTEKQVKCVVKIGSLKFEQGIFKQCDEFITTEARAKLFDPNDVKILAEVTAPEATVIEEKPLAKTSKKTKEADKPSLASNSGAVADSTPKESEPALKQADASNSVA